MSEKIKVLLSEEEVDSRIKQIAAKVSKDYAGKEIHLICVLKGGVFFTCELAKRITVPVSLDFMSVSSYGDDTKSSGVVKIVKDLDQPLEGKDVLIVEDIKLSHRNSEAEKSKQHPSVYIAGQTGAKSQRCKS